MVDSALVGGPFRPIFEVRHFGPGSFCPKSIETIIDHICINLLVPSVLKINIGNSGNQENYWGGLSPPLIYLATWISSIGFCVSGNQQINANMVKGIKGTDGRILGLVTVF